ncbi:MAG: type II secretion system protein J [Vulcanimicrobiota bacterium]
MNRRGFTLGELLVGALITGLLLAMLFAIFRTGASAWHKTDAQADLTGSLQRIGARFVACLEQADLQTVQVSPDRRILAAVVATDAAGNLHRDANGDLLWQRYVLFWWDSVRQEVYTRELPHANIPQGEFLTDVDLGSGPQPLSFYANSGRRLAGEITDFEVGYTGQIATMRAVGTHQRYGSERAETVEMQFAARPRN